MHIYMASHLTVPARMSFNAFFQASTSCIRQLRLYSRSLLVLQQGNAHLIRSTCAAKQWST